VEIIDHARHCAVLWFGEIMNRKLYRELGYSSIYQYAAEELGFSATRTGDFKRLAEKLAALPAVADKVRSGELGYTKAREIVKVADPDNENDWLDVAEQQSRRELEETVRRAKREAKSRSAPGQGALVDPVPASTPRAAVRTRIGFEMTPTQLARYESLLARIPGRADQAELLLDMMEAYLDTDEIAPRGANPPRHQIHVHECPTCHKASVPTSRGEMELENTEAAAARCDALVQEPGMRNTSTIPPRIRREVLARDRHRCRRKGCSHNRFLDIHHLVPRREGGTHDPANLVTLCASCHRLWHEKGGDLSGLLSDRLGPKEIHSCSRPPANT
jgi:5-methylcytosine-specific restriction endonuclease McrA